MVLIGNGFLHQPIKINILNFMIRFTLLFICNGLCSWTYGQLPNTHIYSCKIKDIYEQQWTVNNIQFLSSDNIDGYNNQPYFINEDELYIVQRTPSSTNTDVYHINLKTKVKQQITRTEGSEYSPRLHPENKEIITAVYVPETDSTQQHLIGINASSGMHDAVYLDHQGKVGYYRHVSKNKWLCFLVAEPHILAICEEGTNAKNIFASDIGRTLEVVDIENILFVHKILADNWQLKSYNLLESKAKVLCKMPLNAEDFIRLNTGEIICSSGSKILKYDDNINGWKVLCDFASYGIHNINRLTIQNNTLVFVDVIKK